MKCARLEEHPYASRRTVAVMDDSNWYPTEGFIWEVHPPVPVDQKPGRKVVAISDRMVALDDGSIHRWAMTEWIKLPPIPED